MFGNVTALVGLDVTGKYRNRSMQHTCSRHAAWFRELRMRSAGTFFRYLLSIIYYEFTLGRGTIYYGEEQNLL